MIGLSSFRRGTLRDRRERQGMKVSKTVSIDLELLQMVLKIDENFSKVVTDALEMWLAEKLENEQWAIKENSEKDLPSKKDTR